MSRAKAILLTKPILTTTTPTVPRRLLPHHFSNAPTTTHLLTTSFNTFRGINTASKKSRNRQSNRTKEDQGGISNNNSNSTYNSIPSTKFFGTATKDHPPNDNLEQQQRKPHHPPLIKYQELHESIYNHYYYHCHNNNNNKLRFESKLPIFDASPLFDPAKFCRRSAFHGGFLGGISGTAAAKRLRKGRNEAIGLLQNELCNRGIESNREELIDDDASVDGVTTKDDRNYSISSESGIDKKKPNNKRRRKLRHKKFNIKTKKGSTSPTKAFVLSGHGVPLQLLQDHSDLCNSILSTCGPAAECSFSNFDGELTVDWMRIRKKDGKNYASPWPPLTLENNIEEYQHRLNLYLTVMNRLATTFGQILDPCFDGYYLHATNTTDPFPQNGDDRPRHWNVQFLRGLSYPPILLPTPKRLDPIVELTQQDGVSAPRNVRISLQSVPASSSERFPVTLVFDACFGKSVA